MRAAIYSPYLDTLGGGERYIVSVARVLADHGYDVDLEWHDSGIKKALEDRFGFGLEKINIVPQIKRGDGYDICFWLSDGSIPTLSSRKNFLHFQVPFKNVGGKTLLNRMKLFRIKKIISNSYFTKKFIDKEFGVNSIVIYPPVDTDKIKARKKENIILYVGRFSQLEQSKRQEVLVRAFQKLYDKGLHDWVLILAGGSEVGRTKFVDNLKKASVGYPIKILENLPFKEMKDLYAKAKIFWSAAGYGINEDKEPQKVEHFGISVVEAMAAGCIPIIYNAGGHKEIIDNNCGFLWNRKNDLVKITKKIIIDGKKVKEIAIFAQKKAQKFDYKTFKKRFIEIL